jgi:hypothetical protein
MNTAVKSYFSKIGKKGGKKTATRGKAYYSRIGKKGMEKRWGKSLAKTAVV